MTRRDDETPAEHAARLIRERREREAAERRAHPPVPYVDGEEQDGPRFARYQTARGRRIVPN